MIIESIIAILATASFSKFLHFAIQPTQIFEGWQKVLKRMDENGNTLAKPLGLCEMCWCFWWGVVSWILFFAVSGIEASVGQWILHYFLYAFTCGMMNLYFLVRLFK